MQKLTTLSWLACVAVVTFALVTGCGSSNPPGGGGGPAIPAGTSTLTGVVYAADNVATGMVGAAIRVIGAAGTAVADATGAYRLDNLPAGQFTVEAQTPNQADYGTTRVPVTLTAGEPTTVNFAVMPAAAAAPEQILLDPDVAIIDLNGRIDYRTQVVGADNVVIPNVEPTWVVTGDIGTITPGGLFTGLLVGNGSVTAYAGEVQALSTVQVNPPSPPQITSFQLDPRSLPASGGDVYIAAAISDGDGVSVGNVTVEIFGPGDQRTLLGMDVANPDSAELCLNQSNCYTRATCSTTYSVLANDNNPTAGGIQAPENYSAHVLVTDRSGASTTSTFIDFVVEGIDPPPPSPGI